MFVAHETTLWLNLLKVHLVNSNSSYLLYLCLFCWSLSSKIHGSVFVHGKQQSKPQKSPKVIRHPTKQGLNMPVSRGGGDLLREFKDSTYTPGSTNIAGWKMDPD